MTAKSFVVVINQIIRGTFALSVLRPIEAKSIHVQQQNPAFEPVAVQDRTVFYSEICRRDLSSCHMSHRANRGIWLKFATTRGTGYHEGLTELSGQNNRVNLT